MEFGLSLNNVAHVLKKWERKETGMMPTITDWLMVIITLAYVIATIFICWANIKSAKAAKEELAEIKKQYAEEKRLL